MADGNEAMTGWRDIASAPRDGTRFLAALSNGWVVILSEVPHWDRYAWYRSDGGVSVPVARTHKDVEGCTIATHYMPLPLPPTNGANNEG